MSRLKANRNQWLAAAVLSLTSITAPAANVARAHASACPTLHVSGSYAKLASRDLYRFQARPWARLAAGAAVSLRAPAGITEAELHSALLCGAVWKNDALSPLTVPGARLTIRRAGATYEVHITADDHRAAKEIQRRVAAL